MQTTKTILMFSVFSGTFYHLPENDIEVVNVGHLPLDKVPKNSCNKCYGRGYTARDTQNLTYNPCACVLKNLNLKLLKKIEDKRSKLS